MRLASLLLVAAVATLRPQTADAARVTPPGVIQKADPEYTKEAIEAKLEGFVVLAATIGIDGTAAEIRVVRGLGQGLDEKAVECLQKWRFEPGTRDGEPVPVKATIEIRFHLP
jgi:TonB family protein